MTAKSILFLAALLVISCVASQAINLSSLMVTSMTSDQTHASDEESAIEIESPEGSQGQEETEDESPAHNS